MRKTASAICLIALLAASGLGCIQHEGQLALFLTSNSSLQIGQQGQTALDVRQVNLAVTSVEILVPEARAFLTLARGVQTYELIGLSDRSGLLALADALTLGTYTRVRITFSSNDSYIVDESGRQQPLNVDPLEIEVPALFDVVEDAATEVMFEIDLAASLAQKGNGSWILRPVVRQGASPG